MKRISQHLIHHRESVAHGSELAFWREMLTEKRASDYEGYIRLRASIPIKLLIEIDGEWMINTLTNRGTFKREEVTLLQFNQRRAGDDA
jgi:hypothetical protein